MMVAARTGARGRGYIMRVILNRDLMGQGDLMVRKSLFVLVATLALPAVILVGCGAAPDAVRAPATQSVVAAEPEVTPFPIPVIELAGTGEEIGAAHGKALGETIRDLHAKYLKAYFASPTNRVLAMTAAAAFEPRVSPDHLAEINALAKASGVEPRQMLLAQCFLDLTPMVACSTITLPASASPDGVARFGRNLDFPSFNVADKQTVVMVYRPTGRNAFVAVGWPGMCGVLSGINEHGLALANMEVTRGMRVPTAMPYVLLYRTVLERSKTTAEAIEMLRTTPRQTANNLMLMDAAGDRAVVEITPEAVVVRRAPADHVLISTNHQRGEDLDTTGRCRRYDCLLKGSAQSYGKIGVKALESMLADASQKKMTLQSMVFEPSNWVLYLSAGSDAARGTFYRLDLKPYFVRRAGA